MLAFHYPKLNTFYLSKWHHSAASATHLGSILESFLSFSTSPSHSQSRPISKCWKIYLQNTFQACLLLAIYHCLFLRQLQKSPNWSSVPLHDILHIQKTVWSFKNINQITSSPDFNGFPKHLNYVHPPLQVAFASPQDPAPATSPALTLAPFSPHALGYSITGLLSVPWLSQALFLFLSQGLCTCCALFLKVLPLNLLMADSVPSFGSQLKWHFLGVLSHVCLPFSMYIRPMSQGERLKLLCWLLLWLGCTFPRLYFGCNAPAWDFKMVRCSMSMQVACRLKFLERQLTGAGFSREVEHSFEYPVPSNTGQSTATYLCRGGTVWAFFLVAWPLKLTHQPSWVAVCH